MEAVDNLRAAVGLLQQLHVPVGIDREAPLPEARQPEAPASSPLGLPEKPVAAAAVRRGMVSERQVEVRMPGGALHVHVRDDWSLVLRGPVESVYRGSFTDGMRRRLEMLG